MTFRKKAQKRSSVKGEIVAQQLKIGNELDEFGPVLYRLRLLETQHIARVPAAVAVAVVNDPQPKPPGRYRIENKIPLIDDSPKHLVVVIKQFDDDPAAAAADGAADASEIFRVQQRVELRTCLLYTSPSPRD